MKNKTVLITLLTLVVFGGCRQSWEADYSQLDLVDVSGRITLDGVPLAASTVIFESPDKTFSYGVIDEEGRYKLMFNSEKAGALPGPKIVRIQSTRAGDESTPTENADGTASRPQKNSIPACYNSKSQLRVTLEGRSRSLNFDLKSDGSIKGPSG